MPTSYFNLDWGALLCYLKRFGARHRNLHKQLFTLFLRFMFPTRKSRWQSIILKNNDVLSKSTGLVLALIWLSRPFLISKTKNTNMKYKKNNLLRGNLIPTRFDPCHDLFLKSKFFCVLQTWVSPNLALTFPWLLLSMSRAAHIGVNQFPREVWLTKCISCCYNQTVGSVRFPGSQVSKKCQKWKIGNLVLGPFFATCSPMRPAMLIYIKNCIFIFWGLWLKSQKADSRAIFQHKNRFSIETGRVLLFFGFILTT